MRGGQTLGTPEDAEEVDGIAKPAVARDDGDFVVGFPQHFFAFSRRMRVRNRGGIENNGAFLVLNEMLFQSYEGVLRFFPCWPREQNARFGDLRAYGEFLVSAELKDGKVCGVRIISEKGKDCTVQNPWPGSKVQIVRNGKLAETVSGERFTLKTGVGEVLALETALIAAR